MLGLGEGALFCNPASLKRERLTVRWSPDGGRTWPFARVLNEGPSGYSDLAALPGGAIGCLYECGETAYHERIGFARFEAEWIRSEPSTGRRATVS